MDSVGNSVGGALIFNYSSKKLDLGNLEVLASLENEKPHLSWPSWSISGKTTNDQE